MHPKEPTNLPCLGPWVTLYCLWHGNKHVSLVSKKKERKNVKYWSLNLDKGNDSSTSYGLDMIHAYLLFIVNYKHCHIPHKPQICLYARTKMSMTNFVGILNSVLHIIHQHTLKIVWDLKLQETIFTYVLLHTCPTLAFSTETPKIVDIIILNRNLHSLRISNGKVWNS